MTKITIIGSQQSGKTTLAAKLGKKGNVSDFTMYDFAKGDKIMTIIDPTGYPVSVKPLISSLNLSDIAVLCVPPTGLDAYAGECIICLECMGYRHGLVLLTKSDTTYLQAIDELKTKLQKITKDTVIENWEHMTISTKTFDGMEELKEKIFSMGEMIDEENRKKATLPTRVIIDQSFNVTGIGCVVLGVVIQGTINVKDKMIAYPTRKPLEIRSIQMHDVNVKTASTGARVGLALKGIQSKDIDRGHVLSLEEMVSDELRIKCKLSPFSKGFNTGSMLHVFAGLQSSPMRVTSIAENGNMVEKASPGKEYTLQLMGTKEISYSQSERFILTDLDEKQRFLGFGSL
ncbi:MAG: EF-Tu/IF-2/RF-3 family GTPase [Methanomethylovorans sp.]|uniref:EF-Tu/IF-2/RF-3 family GTPase n=1 Tax=Methanomethylovorans sp. TaxID=2758717 RepID=UPI000AB3591A|nr:EF-Tu/IF-2/RF-3 family GTPase [Methanomethylovorans sp.]